MQIDILNIPKEKFQVIQVEVSKVLFHNGIEKIEASVIEDGITNEFLGFEFVIEDKE